MMIRWKTRYHEWGRVPWARNGVETIRGRVLGQALARVDEDAVVQECMIQEDASREIVLIEMVPGLLSLFEAKNPQKGDHVVVGRASDEEWTLEVTPTGRSRRVLLMLRAWALEALT